MNKRDQINTLNKALEIKDKTIFKLSKVIEKNASLNNNCDELIESVKEYKKITNKYKVLLDKTINQLDVFIKLDKFLTNSLSEVLNISNDKFVKNYIKLVLEKRNINIELAKILLKNNNDKK